MKEVGICLDIQNRALKRVLLCLCVRFTLARWKLCSSKNARRAHVCITFTASNRGDGMWRRLDWTGLYSELRRALLEVISGRFYEILSICHMGKNEMPIGHFGHLGLLPDFLHFFRNAPSEAPPVPRLNQPLERPSYVLLGPSLWPFSQDGTCHFSTGCFAGLN